ncbi:MAG: class I adenylate cyclase [Desulfobacula sp.]|nr:class I adenylate cyclase [Desulfobacula sp.]
MDLLLNKMNIHTFESHWEDLSEDEKATLVETAADLEPDIGIIPVLKGLSSYHFSIRNNARKALEQIELKIHNLLKDHSDKIKYDQGMKTSASVCYRLYSQLVPELPFNEQSFYFKILIGIDGQGAKFAFKALSMKRISLAATEKIISTISQKEQLDFVDQYLLTDPGSRLQFGLVFKRILQSIDQKNTVVKYYAQLFDQQRSTDPFLLNLSAALRDPDQIILREVRSPAVDVRIRGLKALSMIVTTVPTDMLIKALANEKDKSVRMTIYKIIENSTLGIHQKAFHPILEMFNKMDKEEQFQATKALIVSGKLPIYTVMEIMRDNYPKLLPLLKNELSNLNRLSFFLIQDIALNKELYERTNLDINIACIYGIIKKRPERVVKLLKEFDNDSKDSVRISITRFIDTTKALLKKEKNSIEEEFDPVVEYVEKKIKKNQGFIKSIFSNANRNKVNQLRANKSVSPINFEGETLCDVNLSNLSYLAAIYFNTSIMVNCDFSNASFLNCLFKKSIFYNVDMRETKFESVSFDHAVFINVNAKGAVFKNCSFQHVSTFNCNFNNASLKDVSFLAATLSKSSFNQTDLTGSSFAYAKISAVSFVKSNIEQTDFSNTKARFCRFPYSFRSTHPNSNIQFNNRKYQLGSMDIPKMNKPIVEKINILLFSEFIHYGEKKFFRQNRMSLLTAFDIFKPRQAHLFHIIPFLLHENTSFPGIEDHFNKQTPKGIYDYLPCTKTRQIVSQYIKSKTLPVRRQVQPGIEGLFTIGSIGSFAQTVDSDIDYWVCINEKKFSDLQLKLLEKKLLILEGFAQKMFDTQVTFFLVDIFKAKNNDFGGSTIESSGSAQARLLKEEFYRTMIYVAGKLPLWAVLPNGISIHYYNIILKGISNLPNVGRYIDLGDIHAISTNEYYGASIWQMVKWLKSPFKSVIKMALLEKFINEYGKKPLLCNTYKDEWMNSGRNLGVAHNDSYFILINSLLNYYQALDDQESVSILLTCFFLKLGISNDSQIDGTVFGLRKILLEKCLIKWGWEKQKVFEIGNFKAWQYSDISRLSATIENYMVKKYKTVNQAFEKLFHGGSQISPEDRTILGRKVFIEFSKQQGKVGKVLLVSRSDRHFSGLHLKYLKKENHLGTWELINKNARAFHDQEESLIRAKTIEEIGAWLVNNGLYNESAIINLIPNPTYVTYDDVRKLFKTINDFLGPVIQETAGFDQLLEKNKVMHLFISINFYAPKQQNLVTEYTVIYLNSWGEMFCKSVYSNLGFSSMEDVKKDILTRIEIKKLPVNTAFYFSKGVSR